MRLIDGDALESEMYRKSFLVDDGRNVWNSGLWIRYKIFEEAIRDAKTVDAIPIKHGRWIADESMYTVGEAQCSVCKTTFYADDLYMVGEKAQSELPNFCPHCGAKMDAER